MTALQRVRSEHGSFRAAVEWCAGELSMSKRMTASELGIPEATFHRMLTQFDLHGVFKPLCQLRGECRGKGVPSPGSGNREAARLSRRKPIEHKGVTWYPGEPTHHMLFERKLSGRME